MYQQGIKYKEGIKDFFSLSFIASNKLVYFFKGNIGLGMVNLIFLLHCNLSDIAEILSKKKKTQPTLIIIKIFMIFECANLNHFFIRCYI